ncbi:MAG: hypothetical protein IPJ65_25895 [Archangiaceae bacterium]|nr:hypothetical protein [Archangiaceae bacterium]
MTSLLVVLLLAGEPKNTDVSVDSVTVNGEKTSGTVSSAGATVTGAGQQWSVVTARTVGAGANSLQGGVGFPGVQATFLHGITHVFDLGGRISVNYGREGMVRSLMPGMKLQAVGRYKFFDNGKVNIGASFMPGLMFYFPNGGSTLAGMALPLALNVGIVASSALNVGIVFDMPMWVQFGRTASLVVPILMGGGAEYFLSSTVAVWFDMRMGPAIWTDGTPAAFAFESRVGVGWRF